MEGGEGDHGFETCAADAGPASRDHDGAAAAPSPASSIEMFRRSNAAQPLTGLAVIGVLGGEAGDLWVSTSSGEILRDLKMDLLDVATSPHVVKVTLNVRQRPPDVALARIWDLETAVEVLEKFGSCCGDEQSHLAQERANLCEQVREMSKCNCDNDRVAVAQELVRVKGKFMQKDMLPTVLKSAASLEEGLRQEFEWPSAVDTAIETVTRFRWEGVGVDLETAVVEAMRWCNLLWAPADMPEFMLTKAASGDRAKELNKKFRSKQTQQNQPVVKRDKQTERNLFTGGIRHRFLIDTSLGLVCGRWHKIANAAEADVEQQLLDGGESLIRLPPMPQGGIVMATNPDHCHLKTEVANLATRVEQGTKITTHPIEDVRFAYSVVLTFPRRLELPPGYEGCSWTRWEVEGRHASDERLAENDALVSMAEHLLTYAEMLYASGSRRDLVDLWRPATTGQKARKQARRRCLREECDKESSTA